MVFFDIGLGMKSGYKNFYPYFIEKSSDKNMIKKEIEADKKRIIQIGQI